MTDELKEKERTDLEELEDAVKRKYETVCSIRDTLREMLSRISNAPTCADTDNAKREIAINRVKELQLQLDEDFGEVTGEIRNLLQRLEKVI